jgi:hypothetical protein
VNIDRCWSWVITKDGQYLKAAVDGVPRWSNNISDAAPIEMFTYAIRIAERVNGEVRRLNTITLEVK